MNKFQQLLDILGYFGDTEQFKSIPSVFFLGTEETLKLYFNAVTQMERGE